MPCRFWRSWSTTTRRCSAITVVCGLVWVASAAPHANVTGLELGGREIQRVTAASGLQAGAAWSPSDDVIAYASDETGNFDIWVQRIDGS